MTPPTRNALNSSQHGIEPLDHRAVTQAGRYRGRSRWVQGRSRERGAEHLHHSRDKGASLRLWMNLVVAHTEARRDVEERVRIGCHARVFGVFGLVKKPRRSRRKAKNGVDRVFLDFAAKCGLQPFEGEFFPARSQ